MKICEKTGQILFYSIAYDDFIPFTVEDGNRFEAMGNCFAQVCNIAQQFGSITNEQIREVKVSHLLWIKVFMNSLIDEDRKTLFLTYMDNELSGISNTIEKEKELIRLRNNYKKWFDEDCPR